MFENILLLIIFACKVEEDLEAMFAGIGSPEDNKPKESDQSSSLSPAPSQTEQMSQGSNHIPQASTDKAISQPLLEPEVKSARSKRKSAQTAELKIRENQSEDYSMYQPRFKAPRESPKATRLPKESAKLKESPKPSSSQAPKLKESPKSGSSKGSMLEVYGWIPETSVLVAPERVTMKMTGPTPSACCPLGTQCRRTWPRGPPPPYRRKLLIVVYFRTNNKMAQFLYNY